MQDYRRLKVWQLAHEVALKAYKVTASFPREEMFGLSNQIRRAAVSVPANIAEGCGRGSDPDFARFLHIAMGSTNEMEYELLLARDLRYIPEEEFIAVVSSIEEIKQMLTALIKKVKL